MMTAMLAAECFPLLCSPSGPGTPFADIGLVIADTVRVLCSLGVVVLVVLHIIAIGRCTSGQRLRFASLSVFAMAALGTEIEHLGDTASYRLGLNALGIALALVGAVSFLRDSSTADETPDDARHRRDSEEQP